MLMQARYYLAGTKSQRVASPSAFNPADKDSTLTLSNGNRSVASSGSFWATVRALTNKSTGKYYFEGRYTTTTSGDLILGICDSSQVLSTYMVDSGHGVGYVFSGSIKNGTNTTVATTTTVPAQNAWVQFAVDLTNRKFWCKPVVDTNWNGSGTDNPATNTGGAAVPTGAMYLAASVFGTSDALECNFGNLAWAGTPPSGYTQGWD